jgi:hypothetical protein
MSDETVIDGFVGEFVSDGNSNSQDPKKLQYYPKPGVKLKLKKVPMTSGGGRAYAKIKIDPNGKPFDAKLALERAVFKVSDEKLVADDIEVSPGLLLKETLTMNAETKEMKHTLQFSDGALGSWICKR